MHSPTSCRSPLSLLWDAGGLELVREAEADGEVWGWQLVKLYREVRLLG
jgi:hypothetical protein